MIASILAFLAIPLFLAPPVFGVIFTLRLVGRVQRWGLYLLSSLPIAAVAIGIIWLSIIDFRQYGIALFIGVPILCGILPAIILSHREPAEHAEVIGVVNLTLLFVGLAIIFMKIDGLICIFMASPLAFCLSFTAAFITNLILRSCYRRASIMPIMLACCSLPFLVGFEARCDLPPPESTVTTTIEIGATPDQVWKHLPSIPEIPGPLEFPFQFGIAYPVRSVTEGAGVGALRQCVLSTGPMKERITVWEPGRLLRFDVLSCPPSMREISIYRELETVHLENFMVSEWGEFRLVPLDAHTTRVIGTSHYRNRMWPSPYWLSISDWVVHRIQLRVLRFVKKETEAESHASMD